MRYVGRRDVNSKSMQNVAWKMKKKFIRKFKGRWNV